MRDELLDYYERELTYLRRTGTDFAARYPAAAGRLMLGATKCDDPHVERLLEGFAFLAARVHLRLDDDAPEIAEALLAAAYPQYVRPIPSMSVVQLHPDPERVMAGGHSVPRDAPLYSRDMGGVQCRFRTCQETTLWPVRVAAARWMAPYELRPPVAAGDAVAALRVELRCQDGFTFAALGADSLRFHISAEAGLAGTLYELLCNSCRQVLVRDLDPVSRVEPVVLPGTAVEPAGFGEDEAMLPLPQRSFHGYRLLQEYFTFPEKFSFVDLRGLDRVRAAGMGAAVEVVFLISAFERADRRNALESGVHADTLRLGCTPVVNLFQKTSEPTTLTQRAFEHRVVPDKHRPSTGIYAVEEVRAMTPDAQKPLYIAPLHAVHVRGGADDAAIFWYARRRPSGWRPEEGTDVYLQFVDREARLAHPDVNSVTASLLCHNGDLPAQLEPGDPGGDLFLSGGGPISRVALLVKPTPLVHPPAGCWRR
ncbi:MAG TPA: type VI secretion system baseplate subunit TssF, partial [Longimicrobium sp.]|nr:type VI secretion system baseplate subunit TssF [Longimicrobium sp.]